MQPSQETASTKCWYWESKFTDVHKKLEHRARIKRAPVRPRLPRQTTSFGTIWPRRPYARRNGTSKCTNAVSQSLAASLTHPFMVRRQMGHLACGTCTMPKAGVLCSSREMHSRQNWFIHRLRHPTEERNKAKLNPSEDGMGSATWHGTERKSPPFYGWSNTNCKRGQRT